MSEFEYDAVLLDVEGTTTPVTFVYEVLFPYAQQALKSYIEEHWNDPELRKDIDNLVEHTGDLSSDTGRKLQHFAENGSDSDEFRSAVISHINWQMIWEMTAERNSSESDEFRSAVISHINWQMEQDKKTTPLKAIQGRIWRAGYEEGELQAPVFDDVIDAFEQWQDDDIPIYIYSSGSVEAQRLLFGHTSHGDLRSFISGYFDTNTGSKKASPSYQAISHEIDQSPGEILFVTDNLEEAIAADDAGLAVAIASRPGNADLPDHDFPVIDDFDVFLS